MTAARLPPGRLAARRQHRLGRRQAPRLVRAPLAVARRGADLVDSRRCGAVAVLVLAVWCACWIAIPLAHEAPAASAAGTAFEQLGAVRPLLTTGWQPVADLGTAPYAVVDGTYVGSWIWSSGPSSTVATEPGWIGIRALLTSEPCLSGAPQVVRVLAGTKQVAVWQFTTQWQWFQARLPTALAGSPLSLDYRCVLIPNEVNHDGDTRQLAVAIAALRPLVLP